MALRHNNTRALGQLTTLPLQDGDSARSGFTFHGGPTSPTSSDVRTSDGYMTYSTQYYNGNYTPTDYISLTSSPTEYNVSYDKSLLAGKVLPHFRGTDPTLSGDLATTGDVIENVGTATVFADNLVTGRISFTCIASLVIAATVLGNILVIVAVCTEKRLRKVGNSFIVSLAVSDLLVGIIVTPMALLYHLSGKWEFGTVFCDIWVSLDVICCTASIVNLCVISFDRYNAITRPLRYAFKRTPKRAACMITFVWTYSVLIAAPPLLGWREYRPSQFDQCTVSKDKGYTIFSTVGAFFMPLIVMLVMYAKIFRATLKRKQHWLPGPGMNGHPRCGKVGRKREFAVLISATDSVRKHYKDLRTLPQEVQKSPTINPKVGYRLMLNGNTSNHLVCSTDSLPELDSDSHSPGLTPQASPNSSTARPLPTFSVCSTAAAGIYTEHSDPSSLEQKGQLKRLSSTQMKSSSTATSLDTGTSVSVDFSDSDNCKLGTNFFRKSFRLHLPLQASNHENGDGSHRGSHLRDVPPVIKRNLTTRAPSQIGDPPSCSISLIGDQSHTQMEVISTSDVHETTFNVPHLSPRSLIPRRRRRGKISVSQEKTAAKTLGIIIGGFALCWLPFFITTLLGPLCSQCNIPPIMMDIFTWLGYFNSALNPIIYTFFNPDFRKAFRKILCCVRCRKV